MIAGVLAVSALLLLYILRHQFEYAYVYGYSSRALPLHLLLTTFWAGQEGSFLLWALWGAIMGILLMSYTRKKHIELETMTVYAVVQSFLLLLLIVKSPFQYVWDAHPGQFAAGVAPVDGRGLNPLLQNVWMVAHPPILFIGFAAMAVPFVFAIAALWRKNYTDWIANAFPWVLFSTIALGAGIMLGGYWAYGVLGWGGWWGWDPVENSSLIPWIIGVVLIHTMLVQKKTGNLVRSNFFLGVLSYILVVYSTFLTRSGILGESSVHSFVDPGALAYTLLVVWIVGAIVFGFGMIVKRWKELKGLAQPSLFFTRESFLGISSAVMGASALIILFGTSWPILSHSSVEPAFYDKMNLPIAIILALLLGASLLLKWKEESLRDLLKNSLVSLSVSIVVLVLLIMAGLTNITLGLFAFASLFALVVNAIRFYRLGKENLQWTGGTLAHIGLALLFLGIIGSGRYGQKVTTSLTLNEPRELLGYKLTYTGSQPAEDGKWKFNVRVERNGSQFLLEPVMFQNTYNNSVMRNPDYASFLTRDFYIEPVSLEESQSQEVSSGTTFQLKKGEPQTIGDMKVTFLQFDMNHDGMDKMASGGGFGIGAVLEVKRGDAVERVVPVTIYKEGQKPNIKTAQTKDGQLGFQMLNMNIDAEKKSSAIELNVTGLTGQATQAPPKTEVLVIEASVKPFISLIWVAAILMTGGLFISLTNNHHKQKNGLHITSLKKPVTVRTQQVEEQAEEQAV
ncbi:MAG: cytochrome c biogenesis protein CcsA [Ignavibacteriales bacterium]|nr:cytochrome c biogenesis protein CcsA [Ignavibacteriales bacterium]